jgi:hypothetical protein
METETLDYVLNLRREEMERPSSHCAGRRTGAYTEVC